MKTLSQRSVQRCLGLAAAAAFMLAASAAAQSLTGLSTVRSQRFRNENLLGFLTPQFTDVFGWALATGDFNGDGVDDLATGVPLDNGIAGSEINDSGGVVVRFGIPGKGLRTGLASTFLRQTLVGDPVEEDDSLGAPLAACDFNRDGFDDLAIGVVYEDIDGEENAGAVQIHLGTSTGFAIASDAFITEDTPGIPGDAEEGDGFSESLACGDFNGDGFADLAVGVPHEEWGFLAISEGMVVIIPGSRSGLNPGAAIELQQDIDGMAGSPESGDLFGYALAAGNFNGDAFADLAIGVPGEDDDGMIQVVFGGPSGLTPAGSLFWSEDFLGASSEDGDWFGGTLASGDFDGDGFADLAVGASSEDLGPGNSVSGAGQVTALYGSPAGLDPDSKQFWSEDNIWFAGASEQGDQFGVSLAAGDFDKDGRDDLAIGHFSEFVLGPGDGAATVIMGSPSGLTSARRRGIAAGVEGFGGDINEHQKGFAFSLATGDFDADGHADLAIGVPGEDQDDIVDAGGELVLYGALFADGVETRDTSQWPQTVSPPSGNRVEVGDAARLGPDSSRFGIGIVLTNPSRQFPAAPAYVRVGPESGFNNETALKGSFFINPQNLTMSNAAGANSFQMVALADGLGTAARVRLVFFLVRNPGDGDWFISAFHFNEGIGGFQLSGSGFFALDNEPSFANNRIDFEWTRGNPGQLTMRRTRFLGGVPDANGTIQMFSTSLPGMQNAVINQVFAGMFAGQQTGTFGSLYLDEFVFRR